MDRNSEGKGSGPAAAAVVAYYVVGFEDADLSGVRRIAAFWLGANDVEWHVEAEGDVVVVVVEGCEEWTEKKGVIVELVGEAVGDANKVFVRLCEEQEEALPDQHRSEDIQPPVDKDCNLAAQLLEEARMPLEGQGREIVELAFVATAVAAVDAATVRYSHSWRIVHFGPQEEAAMAGQAGEHTIAAGLRRAV